MVSGPAWREAPLAEEDGQALSALFRAVECGGALAPELLFEALAVASRALSARAPEAGGAWRSSVLDLPSGPLVRLLGPSEAEVVLYGDLDGRFYVGSAGRGGDLRSALLLRSSEDGHGLVVGNQEREQVVRLEEAPPGLPWTAAPVHARPPSEDTGQRLCPGCGAQAGEGARFCRSCGAPLGAPARPSDCPACGRRLADDARFCSGCGARVEGRPGS